MQQEPRVSADQTPRDNWLALILRTLLLGLFLWMVQRLLIPVVLGALVALILYPLQRKLAPRLGKATSLAPAIITTGALFLVVIPLVLFGLRAISTTSTFLAQDWNQTLTEVQGFLSKRTSGLVERFHLNTDSLRTSFENIARNAGSKGAGWLGGAVTAVPSQIVDVFLFIIALYFFLRDGRALTQWLLKLSPFPRADTEELFASIHGTVNGAILGVIVTAAVQGALTMGALYAFGVPGAFLLGLLATGLAVIPMIGTTPVTVGAAIYLFAVDRIGPGIGMGVAAVVIGFADNIVRPWVQSSRTTMHPLLSLLSIFGGLEVFGAVGIFIGPVVAAMALWIVDTYADLRELQRSRKLQALHSRRGPDPEGPEELARASEAPLSAPPPSPGSMPPGEG